MDVGVCYFPEHWPSENMEDDIEQMAEAGIEYVRMSEFAWSKFEPEPGKYDFEWLERAVSLIDENGMKAVLSTPTAAPPKWLVDEYPTILQEEADGTTREFGSRRHYCYNSEIYRRESRRIVEKLAERFADDDAVVGWQIDNEYGWAGTRQCYCDDCASGFRDWLREKYGDIGTLNERWGTEFWSQEYNTFAQIEPPRHTPGSHHPSKLLDYHRFTNDGVAEYNRLQADILKAHNDEWFLTHNFMAHDALDASRVAEDLDFASWDSYPTGHVQERESVSAEEYRAGDPDHLGLDHDFYRSLTGSAPWVMEQQPGDINWPTYSPQPAEGAMGLWAHYATAHGAAVVSYFRWRQATMGQEQYHSGLLSYDGTPDRGYHEATDAATELEALRDEIGMDDLPLPDASVAIVHDYESLWALEDEPITPDFDYWGHLETYYRALRERGVTVDFASPDDDLEQYEAAIAPTLYLVDEERAATLESFVENGGELLTTMRTGFKDLDNRLQDSAQPGPLSDLVGTTVDQFESIPASLERDVTYDGQTFASSVWNEWLSPDGSSDVVGQYVGDLGDGTPAIVQNTFGDGSATYVGTWPSADLAAALVGDLLSRAGVETTERLPDQVRIMTREDMTWIANFSDGPVAIDAPSEAEWILGDASLDAFDIAVTNADATALSVETE